MVRENARGSQFGPVRIRIDMHEDDEADQNPGNGSDIPARLTTITLRRSARQV
jgi:hypothetical protein